jgi:hypothetical protein
MLAGISIFHPLTHIYATAFTILYGSWFSSICLISMCVLLYTVHVLVLWSLDCYTIMKTCGNIGSFGFWCNAGSSAKFNFYYSCINLCDFKLAIYYIFILLFSCHTVYIFSERWGCTPSIICDVLWIF